MRPLPDPDERELQYKVVDAIVSLVLLFVFVVLVGTFFAACTSPTAPATPEPPPSRPHPCWGPPPCLSLKATP